MIEDNSRDGQFYRRKCHVVESLQYLYLSLLLELNQVEDREMTHNHRC